MIYLLSANLIICLYLVVAIFCVRRKQNDLEAKNIKDMKWLFDSLYSINHNVKLPEEVSVKQYKPAVVIHKSKDPYNEFNGMMDDRDIIESE